MKLLLINPPLGGFSSLYSAAPVLLGQLKNNNIDAQILDFNVEFLREIMSPGYLKQTLNYLYEILDNPDILNEGVKPSYKLNKVQLEYLVRKIKKYLDKYKESINSFITQKESFYDVYIKMCHSHECEIKENNKNYIKIISALCVFAFLPYYPDEYTTAVIAESTPFPSIKNLVYKYNYKDIIDKCSNEKRNIYIDFYKKKIKNFNLDKYEVISITIPWEQNIYPALTLAKILKEKTKAKVVIGGIIPTTNIDSFIKHPDMFGTFFDGILIGDGETSIVQYVDYVNNKISPSEISGFVYKHKGKILKNDIVPITNIEDVFPPEYDGVDLNSYICRNYAELEFAKGCYWHKCTYCYNNLWKKHYIKSPVAAVNILEYLFNKYGINFFHIVDDALTLNFAKKFAQEIIARNLKIKYVCFFRAEKGLSYELLKLLKKSGCTGIFFGIESGSDRILKLMNKGIDLNVAVRILKDCYNLGIHTACGFMFGFPTETEEDIHKTIKFIKDNEKYIGTTNHFIFHITKSSAMLTEENKKKYSITNIKQPEEFSEDITYDSAGLSKKRIADILKENNIIASHHTKGF